jgi:flagellar biosynthesis GTPase FlhF
MATTNGNGQQSGGVRTYRGRTLNEILPQIRSELGPDAIILREREGLLGGVGGFFAQRFVEVDARRGDGQSIDIYDDAPESDLRIRQRPTSDDVVDRPPPAVLDEAPEPRRPSAPAPQPELRSREPQRFVPPQVEPRRNTPPQPRPRPRAEPPSESPATSRRFETDVFMERLREASAAWSDEDEQDDLLLAPPTRPNTPEPPFPLDIDAEPIVEDREEQPPSRPRRAIPQPAAKPRPPRATRATVRADREAAKEAERAARAAAKREEREAARVERLAAREREKATTDAATESAAADAAAAQERAVAAAARERTEAVAAQDRAEAEAAVAAERERAAAQAIAAAAAARADAAARLEAEAAARPTTRARPSSLSGNGLRPAPRPATPATVPAAAVASGPQQVGKAVIPSGALLPEEGVIGTLRGMVTSHRRAVPRSATPKALDALTVAAVANELSAKGASEAFAAQLISVAGAHGAVLRGGLREAAEAEVARRIVPAPELPPAGAAIAFIGAGGSGKTACTAALASAYRHGSTLPVSVVALESTNRGSELRKLLGREGVPVVAQGVERARRTIGKARDGGVVIVDTPAVTPTDPGAVQALGRTLEALGLDAVYVALPATLGPRAARRALSSFGSLRPSAVAITHADETDQLAVSLEIAISHRIPLAYLHAGTDHRSALSSVDPVAIARHLLP